MDSINTVVDEFDVYGVPVIDDTDPTEFEFELDGDDDPELTEEEVSIRIDEVFNDLHHAIGEFLQFGSVADLVEEVANHLHALDEATDDDGLTKN